VRGPPDFSKPDRFAFNFLALLSVVALTYMTILTSNAQDCMSRAPTNVGGSQSSGSLWPLGTYCKYTLEGGGRAERGPGATPSLIAAGWVLLIGVGLLYPPTRLWRIVGLAVAAMLTAVGVSAVLLGGIPHGPG